MHPSGQRRPRWVDAQITRSPSEFSLWLSENKSLALVLATRQAGGVSIVSQGELTDSCIPKLSQLDLRPTSVQELDTRIEEISGDIERQKAVLRGLERDKSLLQGKLNAIRDPIARLPLEISSEIFVQCLPDDDDPPQLGDVRTAPTLLLNVCNAWTDIALSNPKLWSSIDLEFPARRAGIEVMAEKWLQRARSHPLNVSYFRAAVFWELWGTEPDPLPLLQVLEIRGHSAFEYSRRPLLHFLSLSPNLTELILWIALEDEDQEIDYAVLPNLLRMECGRNDGSHDYFRILRYIRAPRLESLIVHSPRADTDIIPFLRRLLSPLQELVIHGPEALGPLDEILVLVPSLIRLEIEDPHIKHAGQLFRLLAQPPPSEVLPNRLRILKLDIIDSHSKVDKWTDASWDTFLGVARRTRIGCIHMIDRFDLLLETLPYHVWDSLRDLANGGKDTYLDWEY